MHPACANCPPASLLTSASESWTERSVHRFAVRRGPARGQCLPGRGPPSTHSRDAGEGPRGRCGAGRSVPSSVARLLGPTSGSRGRRGAVSSGHWRDARTLFPHFARASAPCTEPLVKALGDARGVLCTRLVSPASPRWTECSVHGAGAGWHPCRPVGTLARGLRPPSESPDLSDASGRARRDSPRSDDGRVVYCYTRPCPRAIPRRHPKHSAAPSRSSSARSAGA